MCVEVGLTPVPHAQILWCQFLKFKETELPAKEADKNRSKLIYQSLEVRGRGDIWGPLEL